ncbi:hypothetical protein [Pseudomonas sp.]|uniref:hypothetical protein n=1 Tax=Pseudomonas sp. TaxID=306 RepID=UPI00258A9106|nr:hypothetical protein [Pseudomonas sp.]
MFASRSGRDRIILPMISFAQSLAIGNAVRIVLSPPAGATRWRLLRKAADTFTGQDDPAALVVLDSKQTISAVDRQSLTNTSTYFYRVYYLTGSTWSASATVPVTVTSDYQEVTDDVLTVVLDRINQGLFVEVQRGKLKHPNGRIPVLLAFPFTKEIAWPVVTVHLSSDGSDGRGIGETLAPDEFDGDDWEVGEGWLSRVRLDIIGWSQNAIERQSLRQAIRRVIIANLPVFDSVGMIQIDLSQSDTEEPNSEKNTVIYKSVGSFSCVAPVQIVSKQDEIIDVELTVTVP